MPLKNVLVAALLAGAAYASPASADVFEFTSDHCTGTCGTAPFGTVTVLQDGANIDVTVSLKADEFWAQTGSADFQLFKFNDAGISVGDIQVVQTFAGQNLQANTGTFNGDGTGPFEFGISCTTCGNGSLKPINSNLVFTVLDTTIAEFTQPNGTVEGDIFVADILGTNGNTGPVDVHTAAVPFPVAGAGLPGLLAGCMALWGLNRRRRQNTA